MEEIIQVLKERGPLTGKELQNLTGMETFDLWRSCKHLKVVIKRVGRRYLRFDRKVKGYARLSPAIEREFLTYSIIGLEKDKAEIEKRARQLEKEIRKISKKKLKIAVRVIKDVLISLKTLKDYIEANGCFIIGGDVPLEMAHREIRPEVSTGKMVVGSDLDIVIIIKDGFSRDALKKLDDSMLEVKYRLLKSQGEEVDYLIKNISKVREQVRMKTFEDMVACKIIHESKFLWGNMAIYKEVLKMLKEGKVPEKLSELERKAIKYREEAEEYLLKKEGVTDEEYLKLFTTSEEFNEIF